MLGLLINMVAPKLINFFRTLISKKSKRKKEKRLKMKQIPFSQIKILKEISSGGCGVIYQATWSEKGKDRTVAIKKFFKSQYFLNEKKLYCKCCKCGCVIKCYGFTKDPESNEEMLVLKFASENLHEYLQNNFSNITWNEKLEILLRISIGLGSIHNANVIHRDFHSGNILHIEPKQCKNNKCKRIKQWQIGDLGLSQLENVSSTNNELYGILPYVAPEVFIFNGTKCSKSSDIYSMAMIMWELITGRRPFWDRNHDIELLLEICFDELRPPIVTNAPEGYIELMKKCWHPDPEERPAATDIYEDIKKIIEHNNQYPTEIIESSDIGPIKNSANIYESRSLSDVIQSLTNSRSQSNK